jgi:predicted nuclease of restriction endonuclease-like (RecB) superfamily
MNLERSFAEVKSLIDRARHDALKAVNKELVTLYWNIGAYISKQMESSVWGEKTVEQLAGFLNNHGADYKGFNRRNLYRMKQFHEAYPDPEIVSALLTQLSWTQHMIILSKTKNPEERKFYLQLCLKERYSSRELERQIDSAVFERTMLSSKISLPVAEGVSLNTSIIKDSYIFEFLGLPEEHSESSLQRSLISNLKLFLLELGRDFLFIGQEYKLQVGMQDFFIDLLFFHRELQSLIAFELKITDFKPEYLGKLNFYLEALDRDVRKPNENPSIGVLLCKGKDSEVVEYALSRSLSPTKVAEYSLKLPDKKILCEKLHALFMGSENTDERGK